MPVPVIWRKYEKLLRLPFLASELEWKIQNGSDKFGPRLVIVPYVDARAIRRRLDDVFGVFGHQFLLNFIEGSGQNKPTLVGVLQLLRPDGQWVTRSELCEATDIEPMKGAASGALKRVAATIGIGAYLYDFPEYVLTDKNGGVVADKANYRSGHTNYWKCGDKKYFWKTPSGPGEPPHGILQHFLPGEGQAELFSSWTFDPSPIESRLLTADVAAPSGPPMTLREGDSPPLTSFVAQGTAPIKTEEPAHVSPSRTVGSQPAVPAPPVAKSATPVVQRPGSANIKYEKLHPGTEFSAGFCDAWNFAVGREHRLDYEKFTSAVATKPLAENEKTALNYLAGILTSSNHWDDATRNILTVAASREEKLISLAAEKKLLDVLHVKSSKIAGCKVGKLQEVTNG